MRISRRTIIHLFIALAATVITALLSAWWQRSYWVDLYPPLCSSGLLVSGENPYSTCYTDYHGRPGAPYPLTTLIAFLPFSLLPGPYLGAAVIWGLFNGLLVYGLLLKGKPWLWLLFLSAPYWTSFAYHQFSPLIAAVYLLPALLPLALIKPQIGAPVILSQLTWRRLIAVLLFIALTFIVYPGWLPAWFGSARNYDGAIPLLLLPLSLLLLPFIVKFRDPEVRFVLLMACVPQRSLYDLTALYLLPRNLKHMLALCYLGWVAFLPLLFSDYWRIPANEVKLSILFVYLPLLLMLLLRHPETSGEQVV